MQVRRGKAVLAAAVLIASIVVGIDTASAVDITLSGTVTDATSAPVDAVAVDLLTPSTSIVLSSTTTDVAGQYSFAFAVGLYDIRFTPPVASGLQTSTVQSQLLSANTTLNVVLTDEPPPPPVPVSITGTLLDDDGLPMVGLHVGTGFPGSSLGEDITAADGSFSFDGEMGEQPIWISDGPFPTFSLFAFSSFEFTSDPTTLDLTLTFVDITIHVEDELGDPVPGAAVAAGGGGAFSPSVSFVNTGPIYSGDGNAIGIFPTSSGTTDSAGDFDLTSVQITGGSPIVVTAPAGSELEDVTVEGADLSGDGTITVVLPPEDPVVQPNPVNLSGSFSDDDGTPIAGWIVATGSPLSPVGSAVTDTNGDFALTTNDLESTLWVADGQFPNFNNLVVDTATFTTDPSTVDLTLHFVDITVSVVDENGDPIADAQVNGGGGGSISPGVSFVTTGPLRSGGSNSVGIFQTSSGMTDAAGEFGFRSTQIIGTGSDIQVIAPVGSPFDSVTLTDADLSSDVTIEITLPGTPPPPPTVMFTGTLADESGAPIAGYHVITDPLGGGPSAITAPDGSFEVEITSGNASFVITDQPFPAGDLILISSGDFTTDPTHIDLVIPETTTTVTVADTNGDPVVGATVSGGGGGSIGTIDFVNVSPLYPGGPITSAIFPADSAVTGAAGVATLTTTESIGNDSEIQISPAAGSNLEAVLISGLNLSGDYSFTAFLASLRGSLNIAGGADPAGQVVELFDTGAGLDIDEDGGAPLAATTTASDGSFALTVEPGTYDLTLRNGGPADNIPETYDVTASALDLSTYRSESLSLPVATATVTVLGPAGSPVAGAIVSQPCTITSFDLYASGPATGTVCDTAVTDASGSAEIHSLPVDELKLIVTPPPATLLSARTSSHGSFSADSAIAIDLDIPAARPHGAVVTEGDAGSQVVMVPVFIPSPIDEDITLDWNTGAIPSNPAVAEPGTDFVAATGTVTIPAGDTVGYAPIEVLGDTDDEPPLLYGEWLVIQFHNPSANASLNTTAFFGLGLIIILDDD